MDLNSKVKIKLNTDGFRTWEDGTYACSCMDYKNPQTTWYAYGGDAGNGNYYIKPATSSTPLKVYCDMTTDGGGWTLVLLNSKYAIPPTPFWEEAINGNAITGDMVTGLSPLASGFDQLLGLSYWESLGSKLRIEAGSDPGTILRRALFDYSLDETANYTINLGSPNLAPGSPVPGLYYYHNGQPFTTQNVDNNPEIGNCSTSYGNTPWWYVNYWEGSFWGGGQSDKYTNNPYWTGSGSGDYYDWGAFWIR